MALKKVLAKLEEAEEGVRGFYKQDGEKFVLDVDGGFIPDEALDDADKRVREFRETNINLLKENSTLKERYKDVDPDKYKTLNTELEKLKQSGINTPNDLQVAIKQAVEQSEERLSQRMRMLETERDEANRRLESKALEDLLWSVGAPVISEAAKVDFLARARGQSGGSVAWKLEKGKPIAVDAHGDPLYSKRRGQASQPLTLEEWVNDPEWLLKDAGHLFKKSSGGGDRPAGDRGREDRNVRVIANDPAVTSRHLEDLAAGRTNVQI